MRFRKCMQNGFTLAEIMIVIVVIGILAAITLSTTGTGHKQKAYLTRSYSELNTMANALTLYVTKYNDYPADVSRNIPSGIQEFLQGQYSADWPNAPWPGSVYDYDYWDDPDNPGAKIVQISTRFCPVGDTPTCQKNFPRQPWVTSSWDASSSVYYCIRGKCRAHIDKPLSHPGYCLNCGGTTLF